MLILGSTSVYTFHYIWDLILGKGLETLGENGKQSKGVDMLLISMRNDDMHAFRQIYDLYWPQLFSYTFSILSDKQVCEDILQDVFTDLWIRRKKTKITNLPSYLFRAVKFQSIKYKQSLIVSDKYLNQLENTPLAQHADETTLTKEAERAIGNSLKELPARCYEIFCMRRFEDQSINEIAQNLGLSIQTVKNQISRATAHIKKALERAGIRLLVAALLLR